MQNHNDDTIKTSGHNSLEKYTSHFIWKGSEGLRKVLLCERWFGDWTKRQNIDPPTLLAITAFLSRSPGLLNRGPGSPTSAGTLVLIPASCLQLSWTSCRRGYIIIWLPPTSCKRHNFALNSTPRQSRSPLISWYLRPDAPVIYTGAFLLLTAWPGRRSICNTITNSSINYELFACIQLNSFKYCYITVTIQSNISLSLQHC